MYIYGKNSVVTRLNTAKSIQKILLSETFKDLEVINLIRSKKVSVEVVKKAKLDGLVNGELHQGIIAIIAEYKYFNIHDIIASLKQKQFPLILILDGLEDPHNFGAIIRTSEAIGVDAIIISKNRSIEVNSTVYKVSTGAVDNLKIIQESNLNQAVELLKKNGYWIIGMEAAFSSDYRKINYQTPVAVIIGSEGKGISKLLLEKCDYKVSLPMVGQVNSLNASVATAIILYHIHSSRFPI